MAATRAQKALFLNKELEQLLAADSSTRGCVHVEAAAAADQQERLRELVVGVPAARFAITTAAEGGDRPADVFASMPRNDLEQAAADAFKAGKMAAAAADVAAHEADGLLGSQDSGWDLLLCVRDDCRLPFRRCRGRAFDIWRSSYGSGSEGILCPACARYTLFGDVASVAN